MLNGDIAGILLLIPPILLALTAHECAHALVASRLGDDTARLLGRVTLNPIKHLDPLGTLAIFLTGMFGWAKPVPVNPRNLANPSRDMMFVSLAGPLTNLFLAALFAGVLKLMIAFAPSAALSSGTLYLPLLKMVKIGVVLNVALAVFNMIPIPPLDGSKILMHLLPADKAMGFARMEPYGFIILIVLMVSGVIGTVMTPLIYFTVGLLLWGVV